MNTPIISIDIEDWPQSTWNHDFPITERAANNTLYLLDLFDELGIKTTMFVLGKFAEKYPKIIMEINKRGHEIASHGYGHIELFKKSQIELVFSLKLSKKILEDIIGIEVIGYRAPDFSVLRSNLWALEKIAECGYTYDSSINPIKHPRYGIPDFPNYPVRLSINDTLSLIEFPIASFNVLGRNLPIGGGGYHRLLPGLIIRFCAKRILVNNEFVLYAHPYEFDKNELKELTFPIPLINKFHQGFGRQFFEKRFVSFIKKFGSTRFIDVINKNSFKTLNLNDL